METEGKKDMEETFVIEDGITFCNECGQEVVGCFTCDKEFSVDDEIFCDEINKHYCYKCIETEWTRDAKTGKRVRVQK